MKRWICKTFLLLCTSLLCACNNMNPEEEIIGYWMRGDGYTISFTDSTTCSLGEGAPQTYKIYDKNHLQIVDSMGKGVNEFVFEVDGDLLKIRLVTEDGYTEFTKDEEEQKRILEELRTWEAIALEEQILQEQIEYLKSEIDVYRNEIADIQKKINRNTNAIGNNEEDIIKWQDAIEQAYIDCQEAIEFGDDKEYQEEQREYSVAMYNELIQDCRNRIAELELINISYQEEIELISTEIEKIEEEIEKLQK